MERMYFIASSKEFGKHASGNPFCNNFTTNVNYEYVDVGDTLQLGLAKKLEARKITQLVHRFGLVQLDSIFKRVEPSLNLSSFS
jgi:hypothetical protein